MSKRKPYNDSPGYVASRKCRDGHVVVYDREKGGDWIDGSTRWVVAHYNAEEANDGLLDMASKRQALDLMKDTAAGDATDWYAQPANAWDPQPPAE